MPQEPVITSPANNSQALGPTPRIFGSAEPNYSVEIYEINSGNKLGSGVAGPNGQWAADINITRRMTITARCYASQFDPNSYSTWSNPLTVSPT